jgi:predicted choloylglycine hydrolase
MKISTFKGNFLEIGKQIGAYYYKGGIKLGTIKIDKTLYENQLRIYKKYYPELLEELEGVAIGGKFDKDECIYNSICGEISWFRQRFKLKQACTIFGVKSKNSTFVGRNYDWIPAAEKIFEIYKVYNSERNSFMAITDMGIGSELDVKFNRLSYNAEDTINDKGLFIGITFAYNNKWSYGLAFKHITQLIAERCSTVAEAIKIFEEVPLSCPKNFFIADKNGDMAIVQHTSKKFKIIRPKNNVLIQTNNYTDPEIAKEDMVLIENPVHNTYLRYYEALQKINRVNKNNDFKLGDIIKILGDKNSLVCQGGSKENPIKTIWSLSIDLKKRDYKIYWDLIGKRKEIKLSF